MALLVESIKILKLHRIVFGVLHLSFFIVWGRFSALQIAPCYTVYQILALHLTY